MSNFSRRDFLSLITAAGAASLASPLSRRARAQTSPGGNNFVALPAPAIDRLALLKRHNPSVKSPDQKAVLSLGNGNFAFNVDCTGLQTLHAEYKVIPLATLAHWAWHSAPVPPGVDPASLKFKDWDFHGRKIPYATSSTNQTPVFNYLRENPHMLNLGKIALLLDAKPITASQLSDIEQSLDLHSALITSKFRLAGSTVEVLTCAHDEFDGIALRITSPLIAQGRLTVEIHFGYGRSTFEGDGAVWDKPAAHTTTQLNDPRAPNQITLNRTLDATRYGTRISIPTGGNLKELEPHRFQLTSISDGGGARGAGTLETAICFDREPNRATPLYTFDECRKASAAAWHDFWMNGAAIDLSKSTDPLRPELERRIVLSQYLTLIHCAGELPSQETGLLCNSWFGKFHLEMHWWHSVHFTAWSRPRFCNRSMGLYWRILDSSRARAKQQGFAGARWPKMIGPDGADSPSPVGPMLIWQQPHPIYYAELAYRDDPSRDTLLRWKDIITETANFMASFAQYDEAKKHYILGPAIKTVSENNPTESTINPTWELTAWRVGLRQAQTWLERLNLPRNPNWDKVLKNLAPAPIRDGVYQFQENIGGNLDSFSKGPDSSPWSRPEGWAWEHPAMLGALGVLPGDGIDPAIMAATVKKLRATWDFSHVWGWDFPVCAMAAARSGLPDLAVDFLTMNAPMNTYLTNGCNFQRDNVPAYFPGNGGLLAAVAMMSAGWTGNDKSNKLPGWPKDGKWNIQAEGFTEWI